MTDRGQKVSRLSGQPPWKSGGSHLHICILALVSNRKTVHPRLSRIGCWERNTLYTPDAAGAIKSTPSFSLLRPHLLAVADHVRSGQTWGSQLGSHHLVLATGGVDRGYHSTHISWWVKGTSSLGSTSCKTARALGSPRVHSSNMPAGCLLRSSVRTGQRVVLAVLNSKKVGFEPQQNIVFLHDHITINTRRNHQSWHWFNIKFNDWSLSTQDQVQNSKG